MKGRGWGGMIEGEEDGKEMKGGMMEGEEDLGKGTKERG